MAKTQEKTPDNLRIDWNQFIKWFNGTLKRYGSVIPELRYISPGKKSQAQRLVNDAGTKQVLIDAVVHMAKSDKCNGRVHTEKYPNGLMGSFPWLMSSDEIMYDVANGKYDNPPEHVPTAAERRQEEAEQREVERQRKREEARRIEEEEREAKRRQREYDEAHRATPEELEKIFAEFKLPPLTKPDE